LISLVRRVVAVKLEGKNRNGRGRVLELLLGGRVDSSLMDMGLGARLGGDRIKCSMSITWNEIRSLELNLTDLAVVVVVVVYDGAELLSRPAASVSSVLQATEYISAAWSTRTTETTAGSATGTTTTAIPIDVVFTMD
jgi:hypothetical protein